LCAALSGCALVIPQTEALRTSWPADLPRHAELTQTPFFPQDEYQCGPAALATALAALKVPVTPEALVDQVYIPARKGTVQVEMLAAARRYGMVSYALAPSYTDVLREIASGTPVVVLQKYGVWPIEIWHYAVAIGYDAVSSRLALRSGEKPRLTMPLAVFEYTWKPSRYWAMVVVPPDRIPATADRARYLEAIVALERARQPRAAATAYATFLSRWPDDLAAGVGLANAHYALGDLLQAEAALRRALNHHPDSPLLLNNLAHIVSDLGRDAEALNLIDRAAIAPGAYAAAVDETRALIVKRLAGDRAAF
jgi:tetratricopeptide (TPR) repeat protein